MITNNVDTTLSCFETSSAVPTADLLRPSSSNSALAGWMETVRAATSSGLSSATVMVYRLVPAADDILAVTEAGRLPSKCGNESVKNTYTRQM
ncbi:hypothetical protein DPMN_021382 [Dreissena polymorpha]|uniref:Uncharacterized protein n=1 Tax=Dreissena polymorpha TaxID=45954 RepID=A0A9D4SBQ6_DREPO|nr:hypothetical protein DPMN_021382 [Dreissena polymorpha]